MGDKAIERFRGDTYADVVEVLVDGAVRNITDDTFLLTVNRKETPVTIDDQLYQIAGVTVDALLGLVSFAPSALQADQEPKRFFYDVEMINVSGQKRTILKDTYTYKQDITKS